MQGTVSAEAFMLVGEDVISKKKRNTKSDMIRRRRFQSNFGTAQVICSNIWARIVFTRRKQIPFSNPAPKHPLWVLHLMKTYGTEDCLASKIIIFHSYIMIAYGKFSLPRFKSSSYSYCIDKTIFPPY